LGNLGGDVWRVRLPRGSGVHQVGVPGDEFSERWFRAVVGVFAKEPAARVAALAGEIGLDIVQLHGESPEFPAGLRVWRALPVAPGFDAACLDRIPGEAFLLDAPSGALHGGTGRSFDWALARGARRPVILAGGLDEMNVRRAIEEARPWGVDACSRLESAPGRKDHFRMAKFLKAAQP